MIKVAITGARGLIGWHAAARLHAANCGAKFRGEAIPYDIVQIDRTNFDEDAAFDGSALVLHFAGVNRASDDQLEGGNEALAAGLTERLARVAPKATVVYANSVHHTRDNAYGRGKRKAGEAVAAHSKATGAAYVDLILPHIFGEAGRPNYNNVTGTLCQQIANGKTPEVNPDGRVQLLHAGEAAQRAIDLGLTHKSATETPAARDISVPELAGKLMEYHRLYTGFIFPDLSDPFEVDLFNTYRQHLYPDHFPRAVKVNTDARGRLFEMQKGGGGGQGFISWTESGVTRGEHFHLKKVERFLVVEGKAQIAMRKVLTDETHVFEVSGDTPAYVDMPTLWTHNITNVGGGPLITTFWTHDIFDPAAPDTFADPVGKRA